MNPFLRRRCGTIRNRFIDWGGKTTGVASWIIPSRLRFWPTLALLTCLAGPLNAWAVEPTAFRFFKGLSLPLATEEDLFAVPLDSDVYFATRTDFPDIRIFDQENVEVPFLIEKASETVTDRTRQWDQAEVRSLHQLENNRLEIVLARPRSLPSADGFKLEIPLQNFERHVQVFGSRDANSWTLLVKNGLIYDYSRFMDVRNMEIPLPSNEYPFWKLVIDPIIETSESPWMEMTRKIREGKEEEQIRRGEYLRIPLRIDRVQVWRWVPRVDQRAKLVQHSVQNVQVSEDSKTKCTYVEFSTRREPLTRLTLQTPSRNFSREVNVQIPIEHGEQTDWENIAGGTIYRLRFRDFQRENLTICCPEHRSPSWRFVIQNKDNPPIEVAGVTAMGPRYQLVFLAQKGKEYQVYYGAERVESPQYDTAHVLVPLRAGHQPREGQLHPQQCSQEPELPPYNLLEHPWVLISAIGLMILVLGWALFHASFRIHELPQDNPPPQES